MRCIRDPVSFVGKILSHVRAPKSLREDLFSAGLEALVEAERRYDAALGAFTPYAMARVRGGILDERRRLASQIGRYRRRPFEAHPTFMAIEVWHDELQSVAVDAEIQRPADPAQHAEASERARRLTEALELLGEQDRIVLSLYYLEDLKLREIGRVLDVGESRVCQVHGRALGNLRRMLEHGPDAEAKRRARADARRQAHALRGAERERLRAAAMRAARPAENSRERLAATARHDAAIAARIARIVEAR